MKGWVWILSFPFTFPTFPKLLKPFPVADNSFPGKGKEGKDLWPFPKLLKPFPVAAFPFPVAAFPFPVATFPFPIVTFPAFPGNYPLGAVHIWRPIFGLANFLTYLPTHVQFCPIISIQFSLLCPIFANPPTYPKIGRRMWTAPYLVPLLYYISAWILVEAVHRWCLGQGHP